MSSLNTNNGPNTKKEEKTKLLTGSNNRVEELAIQDFLYIYNHERDKKTAYFLWFFLGLGGIHHIYLRRYLHFIICVLWLWITFSFLYIKMYVLCFAVPYIVVWLIDGLRMQHLVDIANNDIVPKEKKINPWSVYDIYLFWIPPFGIGGLHHFYTGYYWRFVTYLFSLGFIGFGWLLDLVLIPCYYYPKLKQSFLNKIENKEVFVKHHKTKGQLWMCWFPFNGWLGLHHYYCGDISLGICYTLTCGGWLLGWLLDLFLLNHFYRRFDENIEKQHDKWKKENDIGNVSATDNESKHFRPKYPLIFKKTYYHAYITWLSGLCVFGFQHLYLQNWIIFLGHILTFGGAGIMWIVDFFLLPSFVRYSNERLGLIEKVGENDVGNNITNNGDNKMDDNNNNNNNVIISNLESYKNNQVKQVQYNFETEYRHALYTTYLYWFPLIGLVGAYYIYLRQYKQFILRLFTLNFFLIGWIIDLFRIPSLVRNKLKEEESQNNNNRNEHLIQ